MTWIENAMVGFVCGAVGGVVYHHVARWGVTKSVDVFAPEPPRQADAVQRRVRNRYGRCADCDAAEDEWCQQTCPAVDLMDYR